MAEAVQIMRVLECRLTVEPLLALHLVIADAVIGKQPVDMFALAQPEAGMIGNTEAPRQFLDDEEIGAHGRWRFHHLGPDQDVLMPAAPIEVVMLQEHRCWQHDIGELRRVGHELFVYRDEQVVPQESTFHQPLFRCDVHRIGVLDQHGRHRAAMAQRLGIAGQDPADLRLVEHAHIGVVECGTDKFALVQFEDVIVGMKCTAAFVFPRAQHRGDRSGRMDRHRAVALAGKAVTEAEIALWRRTNELGKRLDFLDGKPCYHGCPFGRARLQVRFEPCRIIGEFGHIGAVGITVAEGDMHDRTGECCIRSRFQHQAHIGLLDRGIVVDVDDHDLGTALLAGLDRVGHDVDLGGNRIRPPDHHAVGFRHLTRIGATQRPGRHRKTGPGHIGADRAEEAGIALGVA